MIFHCFDALELCGIRFMSEKIISEQPDFLNNYLNNAEFYNWVLAEIEKRKNENINILKELSLID